ncbi:MAG: DUF262 domain-containing HNH endonuclease family protein [Hyphomicrobiaceae bacterium]
MNVPIASSCESVESVLSGPHKFQVPYFQRGYAWHEEHASRLLTDLLTHADASSGLDWYPLGSIILTDRPDEPALEIADGHQRLITLTIILSILRDLEQDRTLRTRLARCVLDQDGSPRIVALVGMRDLLYDFVQKEGASARPYEAEASDLSPSEEAVLDNRAVLATRVTELSAAMRSRLGEFLLSRTILVQVAVRDQAAARLLFTTMHETGVRLQTTDLLKSRVLGRCAEETRERAQAIWEGLEARLGHDRMDALFLNIAAIKSRTVTAGRPDIALGQVFDFQSPDEASRFVLDYLRPIGMRHAEMLNAGIDPKATPGPVFRRLQYLSWVIRHDTWRLPALHWLSRFDYEHPHTLPFLKRLEALAWIQMINAAEPYRRDRRYLAILEEIDQSSVLALDGPLTVTATEREAARTVLTGNNLARRPYKLFLLLRLNAIYDGDAAVSVSPEATMEHVFPQRPAAMSQWTKDFRPATDSGLRHTLGNLTLLTEAEQNRAGNLDFGIKRDVYAASAFALTRRVAERTTWNAADIRNRTNELVRDLFTDLGLG